MIKSFRNDITRSIWERRKIKGFPGDLYNRKGQHSIRINDQWRICFRWEDGNAWEVEITDYH